MVESGRDQVDYANEFARLASRTWDSVFFSGGTDMANVLSLSHDSKDTVVAQSV